MVFMLFFVTGFIIFILGLVVLLGSILGLLILMASLYKNMYWPFLLVQTKANQIDIDVEAYSNIPFDSS